MGVSVKLPNTSNPALHVAPPSMSSMLVCEVQYRRIPCTGAGRPLGGTEQFSVDGRTETPRAVAVLGPICPSAGHINSRLSGEAKVLEELNGAAVDQGQA